jgi:glycosyltransferase involved in cell wall biosynthesis
LKIAVLLPNYNYAHLISAAIDAIRNQSHADWELAVVDDCSTDESRDVIADYARRDGRISVKLLQQNGGVNAALKICYDMTSAPIVIGAASDDCITNPRYFEAIDAAFSAHPKAGCVFARAALVDPTTGATYFVMGKAPHAGWIPPRQCLRDFLTDRIFIHGGAAAWRRSEVDRVGGFRAELGPRSDFFINIAVAASAGAVFLDEIATFVRFSKASYGQSVDEETYFRQYALVEREVMDLDLGYRIDPKWRRRWRDNIINERLANRWQKSFLDAVSKPIAALDQWHLPRFRTEIAEMATQLSLHAGEWEEDIDRKVAAAERVFESLAGPLPQPRKHGLLRRLFPRIGRLSLRHSQSRKMRGNNPR